MPDRMPAAWKLLVRIPADLEGQLRAAAWSQNVSINEWVRQAVADRLEREAHGAAQATPPADRG